MRRLPLASLFAVTALIATSAWSSGASAATLTGDYQMQGTVASAGPGPPLTSLGPASSFQSDNVMGVSRRVLAFPKDGGLQMAPAGAGTGQYSVVMTFRFDEVPGTYVKILDPFAEFDGLYAVDLGVLTIYASGGSVDSPSPLFAPNTYATVAMVMSGLPVGVKAYFNGGLVAHYLGNLDIVADTLRFFKDNGTEESAGAVSCIRVYSGALTDGEVAAIGASPTCAAPPAPAAKKKCKKGFKLKKIKKKGKKPRKKCVRVKKKK